MIKEKMKIFFSRSLALSIGVLTMSLAIVYFTAAWIEPTETPTGGNVNAPLNTGTATQNKAGGLNIGGNMGIGNTSPTQQLDVNGRIKTRTGFCIGDECCNTWEECVKLGGGDGSNSHICAVNGSTCSLGTECCSGICNNNTCSGGSSCGGNMATCSKNADCCSGNCSSGYCTAYYPCSKPLIAGNKKIFVTGNGYTGSQISTLAAKDNACQTAAQNAGLSGNYKALVRSRYFCTSNPADCRYPKDVLTNAYYWIGEKKSDGECEMHLVAENPNDFFSQEADGNFLKFPIVFDEIGKWTPTTVWTNFNTDGITGTDSRCDGLCSYGNGMTIIGNSEVMNAAWTQNTLYISPSTCFCSGNYSRSLYCVEQ